jgi:hypothetical protein
VLFLDLARLGRLVAEDEVDLVWGWKGMGEVFEGIGGEKKKKKKNEK